MIARIENIIAQAKERLHRDIIAIEKRTDLTEDEKVSQITNKFSIACAAIATQPIPIADFFVLTPIQGYMGTRIAAIRGISISEGKATDLLKELAGVVGLGMLGQNFVLTAYKVGVPYAGGFMTIPLVYGATYAIGRVMDAYFKQKRKGESIDKEALKLIWKETLEKKKAEGKKMRKEIRKTEKAESARGEEGT